MTDEFCLLETLLYEPHQGFYLLERHLARLLAAVVSMRSLGYLFTPTTADTVTAALEASVQGTEGGLRVRLLLDRQGQLHITHTPYTSLPTMSWKGLDTLVTEAPVWTVVLDSQGQCLEDPFVQHKTTHRSVYDKARHRMGCCWEENQAPSDVVLWNTQGQVTETSIANIAVGQRHGHGWVWMTPARECGK
ncbi:hypothetical protein BDF14DRAFT_1831140 [Spinellus fusiger]|nr:hypothetical protein BDF14DRAFT_1831140 [Spinellus fusiger]